MGNRTVRALLLVAAALGAAPPTASAAGAPQVVDRCTDNAVVAADTPWTEELAVLHDDHGGDLQSAEVRVSRPRSGPAVFDLRVDFCDRNTDAPAAVTVHWDHPGGCGTQLEYRTWPDRVERLLTESCSGKSASAPETQVSTLALTAGEATLTGRGLVVRVPLSRIPAASSRRYEPGVTWSSLRVLSMAHPVGSGPAAVSVGDWGLAVGSGYDAASGGHYTVEPAQ